MAPQRVTDTLLVLESFKHEGVEYRRGDRVPTRHRAIRRIAAASPHLFAMEFATEPLDLAWLAGLEADAEARYQAVKRIRDGEAERRERALRQELRDQEVGQPDLERRFKQQENARKRREEDARQEREREALESQVPLRSGFNA
jgi:hypothetical protein